MSDLVPIERKGHRCSRCGHDWVPRLDREAVNGPPRVCPRCKSPYWDRPRKLAPLPGSIPITDIMELPAGPILDELVARRMAKSGSIWFGGLLGSRELPPVSRNLEATQSVIGVMIQWDYYLEISGPHRDGEKTWLAIYTTFSRDRMFSGKAYGSSIALAVCRAALTVLEEMSDGS